MTHYPTKRFRNRRRIGWASRMPMTDSYILASVVHDAAMRRSGRLSRKQKEFLPGFEGMV